MSIKEKYSAAEQPSVLMDERVAFEEWARRTHRRPGTSFDRAHNGTYKDNRIAAKWAAWQACVTAHLARQSPAPEKTPIPDILFDGHAVYAEVMANDPHTPRPTADNVADVLAALVRIMRRAAPVAQEVEPGSAPAAADEVRDAVWRPISTVPMDGSEVLLYLGQPFSRVAKARWFDVWENWIEGEFPDVQDEYGGIGSRVPSHWMPLPAAPEVKTTASAATSADGGAA